MFICHTADLTIYIFLKIGSNWKTHWNTMDKADTTL